jgi:hypothetical protein
LFEAIGLGDVGDDGDSDAAYCVNDDDEFDDQNDDAADFADDGD